MQQKNTDYRYTKNTPEEEYFFYGKRNGREESGKKQEVNIEAQKLHIEHLKKLEAFPKNKQILIDTEDFAIFRMIT